MDLDLDGMNNQPAAGTGTVDINYTGTVRTIAHRGKGYWTKVFEQVLAGTT